jgi:hypothetical protein
MREDSETPESNSTAGWQYDLGQVTLLFLL